MPKLLMVSFVLLMAGIFAMPAVALKAPASISLDIPGQGTVTFDHALHQKNVKGCKKCHHFGVGNGACDGCHGVTDKAPALGDAMSALCQQCHAADAATETASERKKDHKKDRKKDRDKEHSRW